MNNFEEKNLVSIEWESTGYSVLKNLNATVLGIFCEFIDNSLQSYKEEKKRLLEIDPEYKLKIEVSYDGREIVIRDNAGGIDEKNFKRALKPANRPDNTKGLNEFGMGMKYAAVWISNEWELTSTALGESVERNVLFEYENVVNQNIKNLPFRERTVSDKVHYTEVRLRKLESKHVYPWQEKYLKSKIAFIYRNFIRSESSFYGTWKEDFVEFNVFGEILKWEDYGFLKEQWWKDRQEDFVDSPLLEWKYKFDWMPIPYEEEVMNKEGELIKRISNIEISGFVGILPDGKHSGKNGFILFRRGRAVEGIDGRIYPIDISGKSSRAFKYIRLYGEIHFRNIEISFDKSKLAISKKRRDEIFTVIAGLIKNVKFDEISDRNFNFINQADRHRAHFNKPSATKAIDSITGIEKTKKSKDDIKIESKAAERVYDASYDRHIQNLDVDKPPLKVLPSDQFDKIKIGSFEYEIVIKFTDGDDYLYIVNEDKTEKKITITIGMANQIFINNPKLYNEPVFPVIAKIIKCLAVSEIKAQNSRNNAKDVRHAFNDYIELVLK